MRTAWCWKCHRDVPMLEEAEYQFIRAIDQEFEPKYKQAFASSLPGQQKKSELDEIKSAWNAKVSAAYFAVTGEEPRSCSVWSHCLPNLGPICAACGKPLRTPQSKMCAACNAARST